MATCPKCNKGTLKREKSGEGIRCEFYIPVQTDKGEWTNKGKCNFHFNFKSKLFGNFTEAEVKELLAGKEVAKGDKLARLDVNNPFFVIDVNSQLEDF